jgi:hypothetical protein
MQDVFFKDTSHYNNALNPVKTYVEQLTTYIQVKKGCTAEVALDKAKEILRTHFKDRTMKCFERVENGDRTVKDTTLYRYLTDNLKQGNIIAPTLTTYTSRAQDKSMLSEFVFMAVTKRKKAKKEAHKAKAEGNTLLADHKNNEQNLLKIYANSLSGAFGLEACILHNPSNHSTLTSLTRTMTSLSNANNERIIAGNRYYPRPQDVLNNIVYINTNSNAQEIDKVCQQYQLHLPTVEETVQVLKYSSDLYFYDNGYYAQFIVPYLERLSPAQRAAICYTGDLYHLRQFNPEFMMRVVKSLIKKVQATEHIEGVADKLYAMDENFVFFIHHIFFNELKGKGKDYNEPVLKNTLLPESIYLTACNTEAALRQYQAFFNCFFMSPVLPANSFRLKNMRRRVVVLSDTDSTCFTMDEWVKWFRGGKFRIDDETIALGGLISFFASQAIVNLLRILSRNLNIDKDLIDKLGMKNEYLWLAHAPAEVSKHYYAYTVLQEGTVLTKEEIETKGVHLKNSTVPKFVIEDGKAMMKEILETVSGNKDLQFSHFLKRVTGMEQNIIDSVKRGEPVFLKRSKINNEGAYALEAAKSPYGRHLFWNEVFGPNYGEFPAPPYGVIKLPTTVTSKTALHEWIESFPDPAMKERMRNWCIRNNKQDLPTLYLNEDFVAGNGIPQILLDVVDISRIVLDVTLQHRVILETLGPMLYKDKLVMDQFNPAICN